MTREKAIKIFNTVLFFGKCDAPKEELEECLKMAIKALEQEPCEDAVNRQAVCEFLENHAKTYDDVRVRIGLKAGSSLVANPDNVPSVTPAPKKERWIPCSERLPEDDDDVIITTGFEIYVGWFDADDHTWRLRNDYITSIVAWMPLPEPYKIESEDKE